MNYHEAVCGAIKANGADRRYRPHLAEFGFAYESNVTPEDLLRNRHELFKLDEFELVQLGGRTSIFYRDMLAFRPAPIYAKFTQVGVEEPYIWRFDETSLIDQLDDIALEHGVRLVAGKADAELGGWRASFANNTERSRNVHRDTRIGCFGGKSLDAACWAAIRDLRARNPRVPLQA